MTTKRPTFEARIAKLDIDSFLDEPGEPAKATFPDDAVIRFSSGSGAINVAVANKVATDTLIKHGIRFDVINVVNEPS